MRAFLTGGTGLIGSHVAEQLRQRDDRVVALVRETGDTTHLQSLGCDVVTGNLADPVTDQARRMEGADLVVHAAAMVFVRGARAEFLRANVGGTEAMLAAAALACPRVIHLSSVAVYSGLGASDGLTEDRWLEADPARQRPYAASKHLSEQAAWRAHEHGHIRLTTIRPSVVYGERDRAAAPILIRYARLPVIPLLRHGETRFPLVYAANVARGVIAAADRDGSVGRAYNLAMDHPVTVKEIVGLFARELGRRPRFVRLPAGPVAGMADLVEGVTRIVPFLPRTGLRRAVRSLIRDNPYDSSRARIELGWSGLVPHAEGVRRTAAWWRARERQS
jgi:2-alkyl-3-oxoalkanoate reductase